MSHAFLCAVELYKKHEEYYIHLILFNSYSSFQIYANEQNCVFDNEYTCSKYNDDFYSLYLMYGGYNREQTLCYISENFQESINLFTDNIFRELEDSLEVTVKINLNY